MNKKSHILCQLFPELNHAHFGVVFTPSDTLVCYSDSLSGLKKSLDIAVQEVCDFYDGKVSESDFVENLRDREVIMRGIVAQHKIPLCDDLYKCLTDFFPVIVKGYRPFDDSAYPSTIGSDMERGLYTPICWDYRKMKFVPTNFIERAPMFEKDNCLEICEQLTAIVASSCEPKQGDVYYHPVIWVPGKGFVPMDNQTSVDGCPYPAFKTLSDCQIVCDEMNSYLKSCSSIQKSN